METSPWRPRKKSAVTTASATEMLYGSARKTKGKARMLPPGSGTKSEGARKSLNEKLATVLLDTDVEEPHMKGYDTKEEEKERTQAEEIFLGENEGLSPSHVLGEYLQQSEFLQEDHERTMHDSIVDSSVEIKKERKELAGNLVEMKRRLESLATENSQLRNSLVVKEKIVEGLHERKSQLESEFEVLMNRLDSMEKENAFLRYEYHVLEKDLEVRTEEMEYTRRSIDSAHKQHLRSVNKIVELEAECQRLRLLIRKKFPGTTLLMPPKLRTEVEERRIEMQKRYANVRNDLVIRDEFQNQKINHNLLMEQLGNVQEENKNLKEIILKKNTEIKELSRGLRPVDLAKSVSSPISYKFSPVSSFRIGTEDGVSSDGSLSKALITKLRDEKFKNLRGCSEMSLYMDDFDEMEKFAIVSTEKHPRDEENEKSFDWLQVVLNAILRQQKISKQGVKELLEDIKIALGCIDLEDTKKAEGESSPLCLTWRSPGTSPKSGSMTKDEIKKHLGLDKSKAAADEEVVSESMNDQKVSSQTESPKQALHEENVTVKDEAEKNISKSKELRLKLEESEQKIRSLETELETMKESRNVIEEQMETQKSITDDLDTQLTVTRAKLNEALQKYSSLEVELDYRNSCCEELEGTCLELQLQLESVAKKEPPKYPMEKNRSRKQSQNNLEMTAASIKLAECQETILNLRKQLKVLALPRSLSTETGNNGRFSDKGCSLKDQMLLEDDTKELLNKPQNEMQLCEASAVPVADDESNNSNALIVYTPRVHSISKDEDRREGITTTAITRSKKQGFGFLRKLLFRRKQRTSKKYLALAGM